MPHNLFNTLQKFSWGTSQKGSFYSLPQLEKEGLGPVSRLPFSLRIVLESILRNYDGIRIREKDVLNLVRWQPAAVRTEEIPFIVSRILLQDFTGVPLLVDLAAMRAAVGRMGKSPQLIEPLVPVDLVIDHSVQVDFAGRPDALALNMEWEFRRNHQRYQFLKWGMQAFETFRVVPPGIGIVHQVNLEYLARVVGGREGIFFPDTLVGTDSHTTMINGLGIVAWGVGGIEAEAGMLGQPVYFLTPDVVGVHLSGSLPEGVTATDVVLHCTEMLRKAKVVGKFVEYFGEGAASLPATDRATIANMAPEYGATMGFFPVDEETCSYLKATGRTEEQIQLVKSYFESQGMFGIPRAGEVDYSAVLELDLSTITPSLAGPKRPQDRVELSGVGKRFFDLFQKPLSEGGYNKNADEFSRRIPISTSGNPAEGATGLGHGDVLIAAITSCTNTSNPSVMLAAGLLAKKAVERGLRKKSFVKASLGPGSRVVTQYLRKAGLQPYLDELGFHLVGYGCTTCIGNSGPLDPEIENVVVQQDLVAASVLSGNRNFEARVHQNIKANFLASPPLVVAFALAGTVNIDLTTQPLAADPENGPVFLRDIWPSLEEIRDLLKVAAEPEDYRSLYRSFADQNPLWNRIPSPSGDLYAWDPESTYIQDPPFFAAFGMAAESIKNIVGARSLAIFGDSVTTDHISPAGAIKKNSPAGQYLLEKGVVAEEFNSYGSRRGNDRIMTRGTFANVRIKNLMLPGEEGGITLYQPGGERLSIYEAAMKYQEAQVPLMVFAGQEYGTGSSRDWAAKGTRLLGVRAVIAQSFERIHRSNLVGMGVLPCQFKEGVNAQSLKLEGSEVFDLSGLGVSLQPQQDVTLIIHRKTGEKEKVPLTLRIDTPIEVEYYRNGGILPYVLRQLLGN